MNRKPTSSSNERTLACIIASSNPESICCGDPSKPYPQRCVLRKVAAFTLVETLVVIGIIVVLTSVLAPAFLSIGGAQDITSGGETVAGQMELARQTAMAENRRIELRFWKLPDPVGVGEAYRGIQLFRLDSGVAISKIQRLSGNAVMSPVDKFSTILSTSNPYGNTTNTPNYKSVQFGPDGSTEMNPDGPGAVGNAWTITIVGQNSNATATRPATNFATIQVDPITGRSVIYRP